MEDYIKYKELLRPIPEFLNKYLELDIFKRLKGISLLCGMEYASKDVYDFKFYISRYDHSLNVALITWNLTHDKESTLQALFHDISSPTFSHVIDYMNNDYVNQESTEGYTEKIVLNNNILESYFKEEGVNINNVINFKDNSVVDLSRPSLCADRLDNIISVGMNWIQMVDYDMAKKIINDIYLSTNEMGVEEISFKNKVSASLAMIINDKINEYTHTKEDFYMMDLMSKIIRYSIDIGLFTYDYLYEAEEKDIVYILEINSRINPTLNEMWNRFKTIKYVPQIDVKETKNKILNPLVKGKRLISK